MLEGSASSTLDNAIATATSFPAQSYCKNRVCEQCLSHNDWAKDRRAERSLDSSPNGSGWCYFGWFLHSDPAVRRGPELHLPSARQVNEKM